jgi:hypothetical protein
MSNRDLDAERDARLNARYVYRTADELDAARAAAIERELSQREPDETVAVELTHGDLAAILDGLSYACRNLGYTRLRGRAIRKIDDARAELESR